MKKLVIVALVILAVIGGILFYAVANAGKIVASYTPKIEQAATQALGAPVKLGKIDVSVFPNTRFIVDAVNVGDTSKPNESFTLRNLTVKAKLFPLLTGSLVVSELLIDKPEITFLKDATGVAIAGLPRPKTKTTAKKTKRSHATWP